MSARFITSTPDNIAAEDCDLLLRAVLARLAVLAGAMPDSRRPGTTQPLADELRECIDALHRLRLAMHCEIQRLRSLEPSRPDVPGARPP